MGASSDNVLARYKAMRYRGSISDVDVAQFGEGDCLVVRAQGDNPLCGDTLDVEVLLDVSHSDEARVHKARFDGYGCSLCMASADILMEAVEGMKVCDALAFTEADLDRAWGGLSVGFSRQACRGLSVQVFHDALEGGRDA